MPNYLVDTNVILRFLLADDERQSTIAKSYFMDENNRLLIATIALLLNSLVANDRVIYDKTEFDNGMKFLTEGGDFADGVIAHKVKNHYQDFDNIILITFDKKARKLANKFNIPNQLL